MTLPNGGRWVVVAAGGTGGHLFPAEALATEMIRRGWRVALATDDRGDRFATSSPAETRLALNAATFKASDPIGVVRGVGRILQGRGQAMAAFRRMNPAAVVGFGGYPSLPALLAALAQKRPTVIHEQNAVLGRVNRFLAPRMTAVASAFPTLGRASPAVKARVEVVGNPVRPEIRALHGRSYAPPTDTIRVLVTGGSQGARVLSDTVPAAFARLPEALRLRLHVQQQSRTEGVQAAQEAYAAAGVQAEVAPFFRDMAGRLAGAHLVIGRAGASTVSELAVAGAPAILVPLKIATDDHQTLNARLLTDVGAAEAISEDQLTAPGLAARLEALLSDPEELARRAALAASVARPDAAERLADLVERAAQVGKG